MSGSPVFCAGIADVFPMGATALGSAAWLFDDLNLVGLPSCGKQPENLLAVLSWFDKRMAQKPFHRAKSGSKAVGFLFRISGE